MTELSSVLAPANQDAPRAALEAWLEELPPDWTHRIQTASQGRIWIVEASIQHRSLLDLVIQDPVSQAEDQIRYVEKGTDLSAVLSLLHQRLRAWWTLRAENQDPGMAYPDQRWEESFHPDPESNGSIRD